MSATLSITNLQKSATSTSSSSPISLSITNLQKSATSTSSSSPISSASNIRKISSIGQLNPEKTKACSPKEYLKALYSKCTENDKLNKEASTYKFSKPTEEETNEYDLETVQALRSKNIKKLRTLLEEGKSFNACNRFGEALIHMACRRNDPELVRFLVKEAGVRVDIRDDFGRTPLHDACWVSEPNFDVMDILIDTACPRLLLAEDVRGHTPFDYARREHFDDWISFLKTREEKLKKRLKLSLL